MLSGMLLTCSVFCVILFRLLDHIISF